MAVFTRVTEAELNAWLEDYALGPVVEMQDIASGIENTNYFVTIQNKPFVLTLFEKLSARELPFYLNLMAHLAQLGVPCPRPLLAQALSAKLLAAQGARSFLTAPQKNFFLGELHGKPACLVSRLKGKSLTQPTDAHCAAVGAMLGKLHNAARSFTETMPNARAATWREKTAQLVTAYLSPPEAQLLQQEIIFHTQHTLSALPQGVIHADLFRDNVLFEGAEIGGVIDFYFACNDSLLYDLAITVNDWCMGENASLDTARTQALLLAYHTVRPITASERAAWSISLRLAALRFWLSRLHDKYLPRAGEIIHAHNPEQFKQILQQHIVVPHELILPT
jgi:homoserine kinase type II